nr:PREDICTED: endogenous retrovirus group K member 5 Gag polyprotein-like [Apteryx mantelli mantelli]XP_013807647.1 PREDICTED: endogenous retrovirus group K member 5 Gag polyprotein-like [Apteryx mantelli mantelli]
MGSQISTEEQAIVRILIKLLNKKGVQYDEHTLRLLLAWLKSKGLPPDSVTAFQLPTWERAGEILWDEATKGDLTATKVLTTWRLVKDSLQYLKSERAATAAVVAATAPAQPAPPCATQPSSSAEEAARLPELEEGERQGPPWPVSPPTAPLISVPSEHVPSVPPLLPGFDSPSRARVSPQEKNLIEWNTDPGGSVGHDPAAHWQNLRKQALTEGDFGAAAALAYPVIIRDQGPNAWKPMHWDLVKEVRKTVMQRGLQSPYSQSLISIIMKGHLLTPFDIKQLTELIFTPTQRVLFLTYWKELCEVAALQNLDGNNGDPLQGAGIPHLLGEPPIGSPQLQARLRPEILRQSTDLAYQAIIKVPEIGKATKSFTTIKQGATESCMTFIDRLQEAINKQVDNTDAKEALVSKPATENANVACQRILRTLRNPSLTDMIEACNKEGSITYHTESLATALAGAVQVKGQTCFRCGKAGHLKRSCPQRAGGGHKAPPGICPRCGKGTHYARQCQSKYGKDGQPLLPRSGNGRSSAKRGRAWTQIPQNRNALSFCPQSLQAWTASEQGQQEAPVWMLPQPPAPQ